VHYAVKRTIDVLPERDDFIAKEVLNELVAHSAL
jgi:hypothetical protein